MIYFHPFSKFGIDQMLSQLLLDKQDGLSLRSCPFSLSLPHRE